MGSTAADNHHQPLLPATAALLSSPSLFSNEHETSDELEKILSDTKLSAVQRYSRATWTEMKLMSHLAAPAILVFVINNLLSMSTQILSGHLGNLQLAASSLGNNGIQIFAYGLMVLIIYIVFTR